MRSSGRSWASFDQLDGVAPLELRNDNGGGVNKPDVNTRMRQHPGVSHRFAQSPPHADGAWLSGSPLSILKPGWVSTTLFGCGPPAAPHQLLRAETL